MPKQKNGQNDMNKWQKVKLGDICDILDSYRVPITAKNREVGIYPYYGANGIQDYVKDFIFDGDYVLVAEDGGYFGSKTKPISYKVSGKFWVNNHAHILKAKKDIFTDYLCYSTMFYDVSSLVNGATRQKLTQAALKEIKIPLPPMEEQKKIAARLDAVSDLLAKQKQLLSEQDTLIQSTFYDMFGEHQLSQQKGQWNKISDVAVIAGGSTPKTQTPEYWDGDLNWFTPAELENCSWYIYSSQRKITKAGVKSCHLEEFPINTVLLSSRAPIGKLAIARETFYCNQGFKNIICGETVNPIYLYHLLMYNINYMKSLGKGATFKEISKKIVEDIKIPVPPLELQEKFAAIVEQIESEKSKIKSAIAETQTLFNALMSEYFEE